MTRLYGFLAFCLLAVGIVDCYVPNYGDVSENRIDSATSTEDVQRIANSIGYPSSQLDSDGGVQENKFLINHVKNESLSARVQKRSTNPAQWVQKMKEDTEWHFKEGEKTLKKLSEETAKQKEAWKRNQSKDKKSGSGSGQKRS